MNVGFSVFPLFLSIYLSPEKTGELPLNPTDPTFVGDKEPSFTPLLTGLERAVSKISRVHGPRQVLRQLRALLIRNHRSLSARCTTTEERRWSMRVHDQLDTLVREGDAVLPPMPDPPRIRNRAYKRGTR